MRIINLFVAIAMLSFLTSCHLDEKISFPIKYDSEATIPSSVGIDLPFDIPIPPISTNINNELDSKNSKKEYLNTAYLQVLTISALDPEDQDFDFLKSIEVYIKADGLDEVKIAENNDIPKNVGNKLQLDVYNDIDLAPYIKKDKFSLRLKIKSRKILLHKVKTNIHTEIKVTADIF